jgi:crossover junction endodeoxyribonuclease RusA
MTTITVRGIPAPQGSKKHVGRGIMVESSKAVKPWREAVKWAWIESRNTCIEGAVGITVHFWIARPSSVKRKHPAVKPDIDKLQRSTFDALVEAGAIQDDAKIVMVTATKTYAASAPGALITIEEMQ